MDVSESKTRVASNTCQLVQRKDENFYKIFLRARTKPQSLIPGFSENSLKIRVSALVFLIIFSFKMDDPAFIGVSQYWQEFFHFIYELLGGDETTLHGPEEIPIWRRLKFLAGFQAVLTAEPPWVSPGIKKLHQHH